MSETTADPTAFWRKCSPCKKPIAFGSKYYVCSVSTCNGQRTGYVFCSVGCWETHLPGARHRDAAAVEKTAPTREAFARESQTQTPSQVKSAAPVTEARGPARVFASNTPARPGAATQASGGPNAAAIPRETLIIASRLKEFIDARSGGYNTSQSVIDVLSEHVRSVCDRAIENARSDGRKTVMDRDFEFLKR